MDAAIGTWKMDAGSIAGFEQFLTDAGLPADFVKMSNAGETAVTFDAMGGGKYKYTVTTPGFPTKSNTFSLGETIDFESPLGNKFKTTIKNEGGVFYESAIDEQGREMKTVRKINGNKMEATSTINGKSFTSNLNKV